ncbi:GNAT family N-acetyltransferase [Lignipirellula cremea]|uniref:Acetyltransferase (GNAT) family protein n=1 Tax=Lignipirellula cremea TaxID=2528010 RepID=A0A518E0C0_9BACT|nr:GNAT family N-acetyltransferase [Lignipirellula cremea]QDU97519.1 Acetyltransferase (GNAT) family protein [Lignipirellula cremea]
MPRFDLVVECPLFNSFRVQQAAGMFDMAPAEKLREEFHVETPELDEPWTIGAIVGPSGSGKTTVARAAYGERVYAGGNWPADAAVVDQFGDLPMTAITQALTAVGFSSPPSWIKPYAALSNGEQFRCDLARALLCGAQGPGEAMPGDDLVVFDEFTSVVDRAAARIGSAAVSKAIRSGRIDRRMVTVTCHYDVLEWLEPDWVLDMADGRLQRRRLRRPRLEMQVRRCTHAAWSLFKRYHYLSGALSPYAECFLAVWEEEPVAFCAVLNIPGRRGRKRISRIVVRPDYQGIGVGGRMLDAVAEMYRRQQKRMNITTSHPAMIASLRRSPRWKAVGFKPLGNRRTRGTRRPDVGSLGRSIASFEYHHRPDAVADDPPGSLP